MLRRDRRTLLLASLLQRPAGPKQSEGSYDPITHDRDVSLGSNRISAVARMVSWHESFHAFLNASTCHGNAMIFAGTLAASGYSRFETLVERLLDASWTTHETYATVSSIGAAERGQINAQLLANYPDYQPLLKSFTDRFPSETQPTLSVMALASCARVAMQTPIYRALLAQPCEAWPDIDLDEIGRPDNRFASLMVPELIERALAAVKSLLHATGGQYALIADATIETNAAQQVWLATNTAFLDEITKTAFAIFAESLRQRTGELCEYDVQKSGAQDIVAKIESFAGDRLKVQFQTIASREEDEVSLFVDFRHERLVLNEAPLPALLISPESQLESVADLFVLTADNHRYCQFIAMPTDKARALYRLSQGKELLARASDHLIAGLRRRWSSSATDSRIEILLLGPETVTQTFQRFFREGVELHVVCSLSLLNYANWLLEWLRSPDCPVTRMCVLIDDDCIDLITRMIERGTEVQLTHFTARSGRMQDEHTEILCLAAADQPELCYFTPCSTPFQQSVVEYTRRRCTQVRLDRAFVQPWLPILKQVIAHTLREEGLFGDRFW